MFFNNEIKCQYLDSCKYKSITIKRIQTFFHKSFSLESLFEKDIIDFSQEELDLLFYSFNCKTYASIKVGVSIARHYIHWAVSYGYVLPNPLNIDSVNYKGPNLVSFVNHADNQASYIKSYDDLYILLSYLNNPRDKAIICLLYEGVWQRLL